MVESVGRVFVAIGLPAEARAAVAGFMGSLPLPGKLVPPENLHLTLRFLGEIDAVSFDRLCAELDQTELPDGFRLRLHGLGAIPTAGNATVAWIEVRDEGERLGACQRAVEDACQGAGFDPEERPFRPHLTISRIRPPADLRHVIQETPPLGVVFRVSEITVMKSVLGGRTARYETIERFALR
jgi:2'-5' RNA ligase